MAASSSRPVAARPCGEARLVLHLVDDGEAGAGVVLGDQQPDRVGADVEGARAARAGAAGALASDSGSTARASVRHRCRHHGASSPRSSAWCLIDLPSTRKTTSSRDVGGQVGDPLQVAAHQEELHAGADGVRVLHHVREQDAEDRAVQRVHLVVAQADLAAALRRRRGRTPRARRRASRRASRAISIDLGLRRDRRVPGQPLRRDCGDVDRVVAHALQVVGDLERRGEHPEVARHRLLQREEVDAAAPRSPSPCRRWRGRRR